MSIWCAERSGKTAAFILKASGRIGCIPSLSGDSPSAEGQCGSGWIRSQPHEYNNVSSCFLWMFGVLLRLLCTKEAKVHLSVKERWK